MNDLHDDLHKGRPVDVAVIGGGLAGASAAVAFVQQGCSVRLFERRDLARDPNRGDILHPPTVTVLRALGLLEAVDARGATTLRGVEVVGPDGPIATQMNTEEYRILNHAEMEAVFVDAAAARGADVVNSAVRSLARAGDEPGTGWVLTTDRDTTEARFVVGADGADSLTRRTLGIEIDDVYDFGHWLVVLHADRPQWLENEMGWTLLSPQGAVFILPTTPVGRIRIIFTVPNEQAKEWMTADEGEIGRRLAARHPSLAALQLTKRGGSHVYRLKRTQAAKYSGPHAGLVGDAIHTTHTMGGQGLNMAIQDSAQLATCIAPVLCDPTATQAQLHAALDDYEAIRRPINTRTLDLAQWAAQMCGPGEEAYRFARDFYSQADRDPEFLKNYVQRFGGRSS